MMMPVEADRQGIQRLTSDPEEINDTIWRQRRTVFRKSEGEEIPTVLGWEVFRAKYGESMPQCQTTVLPITGERLQETIRCSNSQASGGKNGWRRVEKK